ncbi:MAG: flap endonuclease [Clostridia bacterium]|nr:flap endonuclease [Clostridia bacterium]
MKEKRTETGIIMNTLLLVDGHNLLFRMFYGMPDHFRTPEGVRYNAVYGFANAMAAVLSELRPTHALVLFDTEDCGERRSLDADYKANRPDWSEVPEDELPFSQLPAIRRLLDEIGIPHADARGCEADDLIASYALSAGEDWHTMILSTDRDYWQLVGGRVSVVRYQGGVCELVTPAAVEKKFGVKPGQFADWKCLVGDSSDNIAGVPGVGPKTAAALLSEFGSVDALLSRLDEIPKPKLRAALEESRERLALNRRLILLTGGAPLPSPPQELVCSPRFPRNLLVLARRSAEEALP